MPVPLVTLRVRVIAVISLATALVSVSFRTQPAELELTMPSVRSLAGYAWVADSRTGWGPRARGRILRTTSLMHVTTPAALHATSRTGACAQSQSCPGRATVMPVAAGPPGPGLPAKEQFNMLYNNLTCYIT